MHERYQWRKVHADRDGHKLFIKLVRQPDTTFQTETYPGGNVPPKVPVLYVCDNSGRNPDEADDGQLYLLPGVIELRASSTGYICADVKAADAAHVQRGTVGLSLGCALYFAQAYNLPVQVTDRTQAHAVAIRRPY